jgi:hypothetical protein
LFVNAGLNETCAELATISVLFGILEHDTSANKQKAPSNLLNSFKFIKSFRVR